VIIHPVNQVNEGGYTREMMLAVSTIKGKLFVIVSMIFMRARPVLVTILKGIKTSNPYPTQGFLSRNSFLIFKPAVTGRHVIRNPEPAAGNFI